MSIFAFIVLLIYPLGAWLSMWDFSSIVMATIVIVFFILSIAETIQATIVSNSPDNSGDINSLSWGIQGIKETLIRIEDKNTSFMGNTETLDTGLRLEKKNISFMGSIEQLETAIVEKIEELDTVIKENTEQIETAIVEKIEGIETTIKEDTEASEAEIKEISEQLETAIVEKIETTSEQFEATIVDKIDSIEIDIKEDTETTYTDDNTTEYDYTEPLEGIIEQFKVLTDKNEELYSMYEPIIDHVQDLTEHMEYGNLLSEQIRILMGKNTELISKNEELTQQVEQLLSYQRNEENK